MLMKMMLSEDIAADVITYNSLMSACVAASQWTLALCIFCELRDSLMRAKEGLRLLRMRREGLGVSAPSCFDGETRPRDLCYSVKSEHVGTGTPTTLRR